MKNPGQNIPTAEEYLARHAADEAMVNEFMGTERVRYGSSMHALWPVIEALEDIDYKAFFSKTDTKVTERHQSLHDKLGAVRFREMFPIYAGVIRGDEVLYEKNGANDYGTMFKVIVNLLKNNKDIKRINT
ncbi:hypothetical protein [Adhaeribacter aquaticus]|uniref:hypothetical protein n=1 Tax=Adhaeribacter aquaticus TaxID=299567 RepID=UPI00047B356D|nr:hypothetical protein [Adhaeribacter aquaticus]